MPKGQPCGLLYMVGAEILHKNRMEEEIIQYPLFVGYITQAEANEKNAEITEALLPTWRGATNYCEPFNKNGAWWVIVNEDTAKYFSKEELDSAKTYEETQQ
jgi:hypothetical protein